MTNFGKNMLPREKLTDNSTADPILKYRPANEAWVLNKKNSKNEVRTTFIGHHKIMPRTKVT
jgi:hypothetical protein